MRYLMKIVIPTPAENPVAGEADFNTRLADVLRRIGATVSYSRDEDGRRVDYALIDLEPAGLTPAAEAVFRFLKVKSEFMPEVVPQSYFGRSGY